MKNYYEILEVNKNASIDVISNAYKTLSKKYSANKYDGEKNLELERKKKDLNEAYHVLSDYFLREQYDLELEREENKKDTSKKKISKKYKHDLKECINTEEKDEAEENSKKVVENKTHKNKIIKRGSIAALIEIVKELIRDIPKREQLQELKKIDMKALAITIVILILLGIILWFIPFTNGWMRQLLFDNPLISWIFNIFK